MSHPSTSPQTPRSTLKRARPRGLWKARGPGPRLPPGVAAPPPPTPTDMAHRHLPPEFDSDDDQASCSSSVLSNKRPRKHSGSDTPLSTDLDDTQARPLVTKHYQHPRDYFSALPQLEDDNSSDDDSANWTTRTKLMDISTTAGPGDPSTSTFTFTSEDWLDLQQLSTKAWEQYELADPAETLPLLRGVIHECHRVLLSYHDPSLLFISPPTAPSQARQTSYPTSPQTQPPPIAPTELPTAFHSLLGTTLFYFGNSIAANPELALPGEPANPVPYWIAALDVFETGENLPCRIGGYGSFAPYSQPDDHVQTIREDWRMAIMWGRTLVALAAEMVDRNRGKPPPPPEPQYFPCPIPTNMDYLKTGTIWDDEPRWPAESPFGVITARRPPITRRMSLNNATPHEILQLAMDHFSRGIFHLPHNRSIPPSSFLRQLHFSRAKVLYEVADEVLLLADKLDDPEERKEWAAYADSVFSQIHVSLPYKYQGHSALSDSPKKTSGPRLPIGEGMVAKARGQAWLAIGSTIAEIIEEKMDQGAESGATIGSLMQSEEAEEARDALTRAIEFFERAGAFIGGEAVPSDEEQEEEVRDTGDDDDNNDVMIVDEDEDDADDEQEHMAGMSARARGKQRQDPRAEEARRVMRLEARRTSKVEARKIRQQEAESEKRQLSHLLAEAFCSLANMTESPERREEYYRRAEAEVGGCLFGNEPDDGMDQDQ